VIRVLIAAWSAITRAELESMLRARAGIDVIAAIDPGVAASLIADRQPDVVVGDGLLPCDAPLVILADDLREPSPLHLLRAGVKALLPRDAPADTVVAAVEAAAAGLITLHPDTADFLFHGSQRSAESLEQLTPRELEVLRTLAEGLPNKQIAWKLGISEHTVKFHVASILGKLGAGTRAEAVATGIRRGLIPL
jgi:DNA-binding NarL/FixJ family response regulator